MATRWKSWTAHPATKALSFLMIPGLVAGFFCSLFLSFYDIRDSEDLALLAVHHKNSDYFFERQMTEPMYLVSRIAPYYMDGEIVDGSYLRWEEDEDGGIILRDTTTGSRYAYLDGEELWFGDSDWGYRDDGLWWADSMEYEYNHAIQDQLERHSDRLYELDQYAQQGLQYYVVTPNHSFGNLRESELRSVSQLPIYAIYDAGWAYTHTKRYYSYDIPGSARVYLGYSQEAMDAITDQWGLVRAELWAKVVPPMLMAVAGLFCFVVLLAGAGRRYGEDNGRIHFTLWDKPYLDLGLGLVALVELGLIILVMEVVVDFLVDYGTHNQFIGAIILVAVCACVPALAWVVSFTKRLKAGGWWRHTLVFAILYRLYRLAGGLWSNGTYLLRAVLISIAVLFCGVFCTWQPILVLPFTGAVLVGLLLYFRRLSLIREGAERAVNGGDGPPIAVRGGDLGAIADSINNISAGINVAVEERMRSERMKTELITNVSHDLRTPLTSMITYADLLKSEGLDNEKAPEYVEVLLQKSHRLKALVDELFEAAKAATGSVEVELAPLNLADLIRQCLGELDERVRESGLDFRLSLPEQAPVMADGKLFWRVMENLLGNAFKYAMAGTRVYIDIAAEGDAYRLDVKNMSAHPLNVDPNELTERFTRGDEARGGEGSGLGLSIVQSFVQAMGGRFVLSIDGDLFKATIYMPRCDPGLLPQPNAGEWEAAPQPAEDPPPGELPDGTEPQEPLDIPGELW